MKSSKKRKGTAIMPEEAMKQLQKIFKKRGSKALEMARNEILQEKIESKEAREALTYFFPCLRSNRGKPGTDNTHSSPNDPDKRRNRHTR
jgi:hypothetical protein